MPAISPKIECWVLFTIFVVQEGNFRGFRVAFATVLALILVFVPTTKGVHLNDTYQGQGIDWVGL